MGAPAWQARETEQAKVLEELKQALFEAAEDRENGEVQAFEAAMLKRLLALSLNETRFKQLMPMGISETERVHLDSFEEEAEEMLMTFLYHLHQFSRAVEERNRILARLMKGLVESLASYIEAAYLAKEVYEPSTLFGTSDPMEEVEVPS